VRGVALRRPADQHRRPNDELHTGAHRVQ
jgi:hypothetical protein